MGLEKVCPNCGTAHTRLSKYCCDKCSMWAVHDAIKQLKEKKGPIYDKWKEKLQASIKRI